jgi:hypothetical protein
LGHFIFGYQYLVSSIEIEAIIYKKKKLKHKWPMFWTVAVLSACVYLGEAIQMLVGFRQSPGIYFFGLSFFYTNIVLQIIATTMVLVAVFKITRLQQIIPSHLTRDTQLIVWHSVVFSTGMLVQLLLVSYLTIMQFKTDSFAEWTPRQIVIFSILSILFLTTCVVE